jgi:hypothetical protein
VRCGPRREILTAASLTIPCLLKQLDLIPVKRRFNIHSSPISLFRDYPLRFPLEFPGIHSGDHVIVCLATLTTLLGRGKD